MTANVERGLASAIVALNPHDHDLGSVLDAWATQVSAGDYEVIVVHDGCRPTLASEYARHRLRYPGTPVRVVASEVPGRAASNNAGVRASRGDLLLFVADDFRPCAGLLAAHRAFHGAIGRPAVAIGPGYFETSKRADPFIRWLEDSGRIWGFAFASARLQWPKGVFYVGNASLPRTVFDRAGGFDERYRHDLFDDWEFGQRLAEAGHATHFVPRAIAWHDHDVTLEERLVAARRMGECVADYERTRPGQAPWPEMGTVSIEELERLHRTIAQRADATGSFADRVFFWKTALALAFARGYAAGRRDRRGGEPAESRSGAGGAQDHADDDDERRHEDGGEHDPHDDHLVRADRDRVAAHSMALAYAEEAPEHRADDLAERRLAGGRRLVGAGGGGARIGHRGGGGRKPGF